MKFNIKLLGLAAVFFLVSGCTDHLKEGIAAYKQKNIALALKELQPLADKGNAQAQLHVGTMYDNGEGVQQDYHQAVLWYQRAAEQGNATAQYNLGMMYANALGVERDWVEALKWFYLASKATKEATFVNAAKQTETMIAPEQVKQASARSIEWQQKHK